METLFLFDMPTTFRTPGTSLSVLPRVEQPDEPTVTFAQCARHAGVTTRSIRTYVALGLLPAPTVVRVPGTKLQLKRWPKSVLDLAEAVANRRR